MVGRAPHNGITDHALILDTVFISIRAPLKSSGWTGLVRCTNIFTIFSLLLFACSACWCLVYFISLRTLQRGVVRCPCGVREDDGDNDSGDCSGTGTGFVPLLE